jgi:hypothetical protein
MAIINYASSVVNKLKALLTDDARVIIYDRHVFIAQATAFLGSLGSVISSFFWSKLTIFGKHCHDYK